MKDMTTSNAIKTVVQLHNELLQQSYDLRMENKEEYKNVIKQIKALERVIELCQVQYDVNENKVIKLTFMNAMAHDKLNKDKILRNKKLQKKIEKNDYILKLYEGIVNKTDLQKELMTKGLDEENNNVVK